MAIFLVVAAIALFFGLFFALLLGYREVETGRAKSAQLSKAKQASTFYGWSEQDARLAEQVALRQIEHHLRREADLAEQFVRNPTPETLRAGRDSRLGMH